MEHVLRLGSSTVKINTQGGKFNWRQGDRQILHLEPQNGRQTHACFPVFGVPAGLAPGAIRKMERHGFLRTSELPVRTIDHDQTSLGLGLFNTEAFPKTDLYDQFPFYFVTRLDWQLVDENTLKFALQYQNMSSKPAPVDLAWHTYFPYDVRGMRVPDLQGKRYHVSGEPPMSPHYFSGEKIGGQLVKRDWSFLWRSNDPFRIEYLDGVKLKMDTRNSYPLVDRYQYWQDPIQGHFVCFEPVILNTSLEPGAKAKLEVILSVSRW
jgi:hypothetical protein